LHSGYHFNASASLSAFGKRNEEVRRIEKEQWEKEIQLLEATVRKVHRVPDDLAERLSALEKRVAALEKKGGS
jgi:hypothetical protein